MTASLPEPAVPSGTLQGWFLWIAASLMIAASCIGPDRGGFRVTNPWTPTTAGVVESVRGVDERTTEYTLHTGERLIIPNRPCGASGLSEGNLLFYAEDQTGQPHCAIAVPRGSEYFIGGSAYAEDGFLIVISDEVRIPLAPNFVNCGENDWTGMGGAQFAVNENGQVTRVVC